MMTLKEKQSLFESIKENDFELNENHSAKEILEKALSELGNTDPYIRDELALEVAANIIYNNHLNENQLKKLSKRLLSDEFLFYGLKNRKEDSVFMRTFTSLLLTMLFRIPAKANLFSKNDLEDMYEIYLNYLKNEYDYRGYIENKGWGHFFAHSSDFLKYIFQEKTFDNTWIKRYLKVILKIIQNNHYVFHHNEDDRFKNAFLKLNERKDIDQKIVDDFLKETIVYKRLNKLPEDLNTYVNVKNILRSLYFALDDTDCLRRDQIKELLGALKVSL
ncbi:MAG: DUF2785 domain-containing protein [Candidatus Izemoplasmatales bacterium]